MDLEYLSFSTVLQLTHTLTTLTSSRRNKTRSSPPRRLTPQMGEVMKGVGIDEFPLELP